MDAIWCHIIISYKNKLKYHKLIKYVELRSISQRSIISSHFLNDKNNDTQCQHLDYENIMHI
jgi:hypothetical protein